MIFHRARECVCTFAIFFQITSSDCAAALIIDKISFAIWLKKSCDIIDGRSHRIRLIRPKAILISFPLLRGKKERKNKRKSGSRKLFIYYSVNLRINIPAN